MKAANSAEVHYGDHNCRNKFKQLLSDNGLPTELLVVDDIQECGYVKDTGFVWLKLNKASNLLHKFDTVHLSYDEVITASLERNRIKNLTGVKAKEFLFRFKLTDIHVTGKAGKKATITFKTPTGLSKSFPLSLFGCKDDQVATKSGLALAL
ncbi:hypothetical protein LINGRAHAP2_LOCUS6156 [Linum grandiflorum]